MNPEIRNLSKSYHGHPVLQQVTLTFPSGETTCIMGPSGCGKTTLLRILMGLTKPDAGEVLLPEGARFSAVFQEDRLCENLSPVANIRLVCGRLYSKEQIRKELAAVGLDGALDKPVRELSGGMRRRAAVVRACLAPSDILVLDEPFSGLDEQTRQQTGDWINGHLAGRTVILVTHNEEEAFLMGSRIVKLSPPVTAPDSL